MCLSAKSSCLGNILSICLEETAADVLRPRAAVVMDAPRFRILHWSFQTTRVLSLRCLHGALGFTDLAKKIPQDLAQLCISKSLCKTSLQKTKQTVDALSSPHSAEFPPLRLMRFLQETLPTPSKLQSLYNCTVAQERTNQSGDAAWRSEESGQTAAKLSHVHARPRWKRWGKKRLNPIETSRIPVVRRVTYSLSLRQVWEGARVQGCVSCWWTGLTVTIIKPL